jgi:hypothetical protein
MSQPGDECDEAILAVVASARQQGRNGAGAVQQVQVVAHLGVEACGIHDRETEWVTAQVLKDVLDLRTLARSLRE